MNIKNIKILITGGAGFIGSNLVKRLVKEGSNIYVIDNLWRGFIDNLKDDNDKMIIPEDHFCNVDLTNNIETLKIISNFDIVINLADIVAGIEYVFNNEQYVFRQNILINSNVLNACIVNNIKNYIYVGTACSYPKSLQMSNEPKVFLEDDVYPALPESSYGWSKLLGEYEASLSNNLLNVGILRFHNVYGPHSYYQDDKSQVIPSLIKRCINYTNGDFVVWGSGNQSRDFIFIDDVVDSICLLIEKGMNKGVIQIGSGESTSIKNLIDKIIKISNKDIKPIFDLSKPEGDKGRISNCKKANEILNWYPKVKIDDGLKITYKWLNKKIK